MKKENAYILQKDSPNCKAGTEFRFVSVIMKYQSTTMNKNSKGIYFEPEDVENNTEWFKIKEEEKPTVVYLYLGLDNIVYNLNDNPGNGRTISKEHLAEILIAYQCGNLIIGNKEIGQEEEKIYTEKEWLQFGEECFNAARKNNNEWYSLYTTFSDYMNDLQK